VITTGSLRPKSRYGSYGKHLTFVKLSLCSRLESTLTPWLGEKRMTSGNLVSNAPNSGLSCRLVSTNAGRAMIDPLASCWSFGDRMPVATRPRRPSVLISAGPSAAELWRTSPLWQR
jgi:hypothetical protein